MIAGGKSCGHEKMAPRKRQGPCVATVGTAGRWERQINIHQIWCCRPMDFRV